MVAAAMLKGSLGSYIFPFSSSAQLFNALGIALIVGPVEELGWRGVMLPLLQQRCAPIYAGLILGVITSGCVKPTNTHEARVKLAKADISWLHQFVDEFRKKKGALPTDLVQLGEIKSRITKTPLDPWSRPYQYQVEGINYRIFSFGEDGKPGGSGPNADIELLKAVH